MFAKKCLFGSETWHHLCLAPEEWNNEPLLSAVQLCPSPAEPSSDSGLVPVLCWAPHFSLLSATGVFLKN